MGANVVVGVDASEASQGALDWAADAAMARRCVLEVVHAVRQPAWGFDLDLDHVLEQQGKNLLEASAERAERALPGLRVRTVLSTDTPTGALLARAHDAALLVVGSRGPDVLGGGPAGSAGYRLAASARCPVALVPARRGSTARTVVVGVDGSPDGRAALAVAVAEAELAGARVEVVRGWDAPELHESAGHVRHGLADALREQEATALRELLAPVRARHPDVPIVQRVVRGRPARALLDAARDAELLVVGAHGASGGDPSVLGAVSHAVVLHATCPVVVARDRH